MLKKTIRKPLTLTRENLRTLESSKLIAVAGGGTIVACAPSGICSNRFTVCCPM